MAASAKDILVDAPSGEPVMHLTRIFDAPRHLVWDCFTKAEHIAQWWGPRKYAITVEEFDVRPGGKWRVSHKDDTKTVTFFGEYRDVVKPERLSRTFCVGDFPPIEESYAFHEESGKTRVVCTQHYPNVMARDMMAKGGAAEGGRESFERLDDLLVSLKG
ncbi:MAG TPA: SRPBCC domain-containing protein [Rhizomicrobium sp.]|nr:SRPBCC domain-containing protein [Rhizomicrobium sp.]